MRSVQTIYVSHICPTFIFYRHTGSTPGLSVCGRLCGFTISSGHMGVKKGTLAFRAVWTDWYVNIISTLFLPITRGVTLFSFVFRILDNLISLLRLKAKGVRFCHERFYPHFSCFKRLLKLSEFFLNYLNSDNWRLLLKSAIATMPKRELRLLSEGGSTKLCRWWEGDGIPKGGFAKGDSSKFR